MFKRSEAREANEALREVQERVKILQEEVGTPLVDQHRIHGVLQCVPCMASLASTDMTRAQCGSGTVDPAFHYWL